ncbi:DUF4398 domain-containing protein [Stutzerimonas kirkiae]|uniref:DUF4398 domain-containing protein n=1 Tax=Stutzerimonas kirkiae TaxID=2211392 RepID=A0A4Q9RBL2_9GAMM|nr:DUF4398 domain-containing protein [Stutzerimonas kirkiae]TBU97385.1 hypothetical protein DNJ96_08800 [Stutzerimonas kirkiae]TBV00360.1 hypothetical protein DNJ95_15150 [Stutzerimonas kirkiae]TBV05514.1 hypothetical protein DNK08_15755 [Stutzerimonas kirkiae]TBV10540.1 hypothetical protein DNK01_17770 [Stutzerimonas kirkiae]
MRKTGCHALFPLALVPLALLYGCARDPLPTEQLRLSEQVIVQARAVGGASEDAPELRLAQQKLGLAHAEMVHQRYRQARILAEQAELDARLAEARVLNEKNRAQQAELERQIEQLRKQVGALQ